jgi:hypothetical protein
MRFAWWINTATETHLEHVILAFASASLLGLRLNGLVLLILEKVLNKLV